MLNFQPLDYFFFIWGEAPHVTKKDRVKAIRKDLAENEEIRADNYRAKAFNVRLEEKNKRKGQAITYNNLKNQVY